VKKKILVSPTTFGTCGREPIDLAKEEGYDLLLNPFGRKMTEIELLDLGKDCIGTIAGDEPYNSAVLESLKDLRCISRCGVGLDNVDLEKAEELGIVVKNVPDGPTRAASELVVGLIFDILRNISYCDRDIRKGEWNKRMGSLLLEKKVGILGLGRIGRMVSELLIGLGADVCGNDLKADTIWLKKHNVPLISLEDLLKESDILCVHIPYSQDNRYIIGSKEIESMKEGAIIVNLSRGGIVDETALYDALKSGHLAGTALDVFETEPYTGPLTKLDNVLLTPHIGSYAKESRLNMELQSVKNLLGVLRDL